MLENEKIIKNKRNQKLKIVTSLIVALFLMSIAAIPATYACGKVFENNTKTPVILQIGDEKAIDYTVDKIQSSISEKIKVISINSVDEFKYVVQSTLGYIIYVGHGQPNGLRVGNTLISWTDVGEIIQTSPSKYHLVAACYSGAIVAGEKMLYGFTRDVDVDEAAMFAVMMYYGINEQKDKVQSTADSFTSMIYYKFAHPDTAYCASLLDTVYANGMWWARQPGDNQIHVPYTCPDFYTEGHGLTWINAETDYAWEQNGMIISHCPASRVNQILASAGAASLIGLIFGVAGGIPGAIVGAILSAYGITESLLVELYMKDSLGASWGFGLPPIVYWWGYDLFIKSGGLCWFKYTIFFGIATCTPQWGWGGADLGLFGI